MGTQDVVIPERRYDYAKGELTEEGAGDDPVALLARWLEDAVRAGVIEPTALCLSTATPDGRPSARYVLLRGLDGAGLRFFTNYESRKGEELAANPRAAATFWWGALERQVRVEGRVELLPPEESDAYFESRPPGSRAASAASPQSWEIPERETLERAVAALADAHPEGAPRPEHWGGYLLRPERWEFWQGRPSRLHDRIVFEGGRRFRLAP